MAQSPSTDPHDVDLISSSRRPRRRTSALALVAAGVVGGAAIGLSSGAFAGGTQLTAAVASPSASPAPDAHEQDGHDQDGDKSGGRKGYGHPGRGHQWFGQAGRALHGTATIPKAGGGYEQLVLQRGTITAVSPTSLVVTSTDGFVATYVLTAETKIKAAQDTVAALKVTDKVAVVAVVTGGAQRATRVIDLTSFAGEHRGDGHGDGAPRPDATTSAAPSTPGPAA